MQKIRMMCVTPGRGYQKRISRIVLASCGVLPLPRIKYGAIWKKEKLRQGFPQISSGIISLNNFVKILVCTGFCVDTENGLSEP